MIGIAAPSWLGKEVVIEMKEHIPTRFWFRFITSNLMPLQNESIFWNPKAALVGCIIDHRKLNLDSITVLEILTQAKQLQTSHSFLSLITTLYMRVRVLFIIKNNIKVTPSVSTDIWRINAKFMRDEEDRARKNPTNTMPMVYFKILEAGTSGN